MRFRLVYEGELKANQRDPHDNQPARLSEHKQAIRKVFHRQLRHLWETNWFLSTHRVFPQDYGMSRPAADTAARWGASENEMISLTEAVSYKHRENGYCFVPLVRKDWRLMCSLEILFLRHDPPGSVIHSGDLDNRIKTLIDALRKPDNATELRGNETPAEGEDPFFCLLEDDKLVTGLNVESDRFLVPPKGNKDIDRRQVHIVISVDVRPYDVTSFNLSFA
ncbi:hypothetical protein [Mesorhizobium sp.]|uniref:hypothetical protein n=1 Tax=Mesorhizobium sp. TaxID=1871066 RepID=UPI000FE9844D|nr:hypothetical protein [Mesorhizobium sp.]RWP46723.1 MAG: hypothetical protein EOR05_20545 [Mesorhizobium sp.]